jgi:hypothetical protein
LDDAKRDAIEVEDDDSDAEEEADELDDTKSDAQEVACDLYLTFSLAVENIVVKSFIQ